MLGLVLLEAGVVLADDALDLGEVLVCVCQLNVHTYSAELPGAFRDSHGGIVVWWSWWLWWRGRCRVRLLEVSISIRPSIRPSINFRMDRADKRFCPLPPPTCRLATSLPQPICLVRCLLNFLFLAGRSCFSGTANTNRRRDTGRDRGLAAFIPLRARQKRFRRYTAPSYTRLPPHCFSFELKKTLGFISSVCFMAFESH